MQQQPQLGCSERKMNSHDLLNVKFLLGASEETMKDWYAKTSEDDREYAHEILTQYHLEMETKLALLKLSEATVTEDTSLASEELAKFRK